MKLTVRQIDVTPQEPVFLGGYVQRKTPFEKVHDPIMATIMVLTIGKEKLVWVTADIGGGSDNVIEGIIEFLKEKGLDISRDHLVVGGTHTHSGPNIRGKIGDENFRQQEQDYLCYLCSRIADTVYDAYQQPGTEVHTRYSDVLIDGLYSNRNDKNKLSDKHEYMIGFFDSEEKAVAIYHLMSHHCTVVGSQSMDCSADLFGALRKRLQEYFDCPVFMAQGNAGDMGNRQYRDGNDFAALDRLADNLFAQITNKYCWKDIDMDSFKYERVSYQARYHLDYSGYAEKYREYSERLAKETNVDMIKHLTGWVAMAKRKMNLPSEDVCVEMPAEILTMNELQIVLVPGELGSILGLRIKEASKARLCFVWGYVNGCNLGYMIEKEAFSTESQESQVTNYVPGICDEYIEEIKKHL